MKGVEGRVCVVTGASGGIGEAAARALAARGATVVLAARREDRIRSIGEELRRSGAGATWIRTDVTEQTDLESLRDHVVAEHGRCDVLVNNAGVPGGGTFAELSIEWIRVVTETNYVSLLVATKLFLDLLKDAGGHVVNVASLAGRYALPGAAVYAATKHAIVAFTESLLGDASVQEVKLTAVCPGFVKTEGFPHENPPGFVTITAEEVADAIVDVIARGRVGTVSIPAWAGRLAFVGDLAPGLYRGASRLASRLYGDRVHRD